MKNTVDSAGKVIMYRSVTKCLSAAPWKINSFFVSIFCFYFFTFVELISEIK